jgi:hypothetical protein
LAGGPGITKEGMKLRVSKDEAANFCFVADAGCLFYTAKEVYSSMPSTDVLLTHGPPYKMGNLDTLTDGVTNVGCEELADKVSKGKAKPTLFCFGHIHGESPPAPL